MWQHQILNICKHTLVNYEYMACLAACYALVRQKIVMLVRVFSTRVEYVYKVLWGVYAQPLCRGELPLALAAYAVARVATSFVNPEVSILECPVLRGCQSLRPSQHISCVFFGELNKYLTHSSGCFLAKLFLSCNKSC